MRSQVDSITQKVEADDNLTNTASAIARKASAIAKGLGIGIWRSDQTGKLARAEIL